MPRISALFFASVFEAAEDAFGTELKFLRENPERVGVVIGTAFGCLTTAISYERRLIQDGPIGASPTLFTGSIQNAIAANLSIALGIQGPTSTVTTMDLTTFNAIRMAEDWLNQDLVDHVIVALGDEISEIHLYAMAHQLELRPWIRMGEGVVSFVLSRSSFREEGRPYARIEKQLHRSAELPLAPRQLISPWDGERQLKAYHDLVSRSLVPTSKSVPKTHIEFFGHSPLGLAFELAIGALLVREDSVPTACVQIPDAGHVNAITLMSCASQLRE